LFEPFSTSFNDADAVVVADVYAAGEAPIEGVNRDMLVNALRRNGQREVVPLDDPADLPELVWQLARPGDLVVCLGAGNITNWAYALPPALQKIADDRGGPRPIANDRGHA
jgi:UDP-N-acetylmuramate--alanine ligase